MFKNFWWGFPSKKTRNLSLKSWDSLCLPKDQGGLGFRKMKEVNLALISKLGWKLHTNFNSAWVAHLQGKYLSSGTFLSPLPILLLLGSGKEFLKLNPLSLLVPAKESTKTLLFLFGLHLGSLLSQIFCLPLLVSLSSLSQTSRSVTFLSPTAYGISLSFFPCLILLVLGRYKKLRSIPTSFLSPIWTPSPNGLFSSSSTYKLISSSRTYAASSPLVS
jgi:hypothetical protein